MDGKAVLAAEGYFALAQRVAFNKTLVVTKTETALSILHEWVQSESLRKHCYAVADSMKYFASRQNADADLWEAVGLLHDMDYERHPNQEQSPTDGHPFVGVAWLREHGWTRKFAAPFSHTPITRTSRAKPPWKRPCMRSMN